MRRRTLFLVPVVALTCLVITTAVRQKSDSRQDTAVHSDPLSDGPTSPIGAMRVAAGPYIQPGGLEVLQTRPRA